MCGHLSKLAFVALLILGISSSLEAEMQPLKKREANPYNHHFYSAQFKMPDNVIIYVVCNKTGDESDFFWAKAGFGVGERKPLPAHTCVRRDDYIDGTDPRSDVMTSNV